MTSMRIGKRAEHGAGRARSARVALPVAAVTSVTESRNAARPLVSPARRIVRIDPPPNAGASAGFTSTVVPALAAAHGGQ
jgi:hypothetical protein